jgi:hypothetical protein
MVLIMEAKSRLVQYLRSSRSEVSFQTHVPTPFVYFPSERTTRIHQKGCVTPEEAKNPDRSEALLRLWSSLLCSPGFQGRGTTHTVVETSSAFKGNQISKHFRGKKQTERSRQEK